jgi:hypothetical protein
MILSIHLRPFACHSRPFAFFFFNANYRKCPRIFANMEKVMAEGEMIETALQ